MIKLVKLRESMSSHTRSTYSTRAEAQRQCFKGRPSLISRAGSLSPNRLEKRRGSLKASVGDVVQVNSTRGRGWVQAEVVAIFADEGRPAASVVYQVGNTWCQKSLYLESARLREHVQTARAD